VRGFIHVRDMFELTKLTAANRKVKELLREIRLIPETKKAMICCGRCRQTVFTWPS